MSLNRIEPLELSTLYADVLSSGERVGLFLHTEYLDSKDATALHTWLGRALAKPEAEHGFPLLP